MTTKSMFFAPDGESFDDEAKCREYCRVLAEGLIEQYDEAFLAKYYGTAHRTGIKFFGSGAATYVLLWSDPSQMLLPGQWLVTLPNKGGYVIEYDRASAERTRRQYVDRKASDEVVSIP